MLVCTPSPRGLCRGFPTQDQRCGGALGATSLLKPWEVACSPVGMLEMDGGAKCLVLTPDKKGDADRHERDIPSN